MVIFVYENDEELVNCTSSLNSDILFPKFCIDNTTIDRNAKNSNIFMVVDNFSLTELLDFFTYSSLSLSNGELSLDGRLLGKSKIDSGDEEFIRTLNKVTTTFIITHSMLKDFYELKAMNENVNEEYPSTMITEFRQEEHFKSISSAIRNSRYPSSILTSVEGMKLYDMYSEYVVDNLETLVKRKISFTLPEHCKDLLVTNITSEDNGVEDLIFQGKYNETNLLLYYLSRVDVEYGKYNLLKPDISISVCKLIPRSFVNGRD